MASVLSIPTFGDVSYFNRAFRRQYGAARSDVCAQAREAAIDDAMR